MLRGGTRWIIHFYGENKPPIKMMNQSDAFFWTRNEACSYTGLQVGTFWLSANPQTTYLYAHRLTAWSLLSSLQEHAVVNQTLEKCLLPTNLEYRIITITGIESINNKALNVSIFLLPSITCTNTIWFNHFRILTEVRMDRVCGKSVKTLMFFFTFFKLFYLRQLSLRIWKKNGKNPLPHRYLV